MQMVMSEEPLLAESVPARDSPPEIMA